MNRVIKRMKQDFTMDLAAYCIAALFVIVTAVPVLNVFSKAFSSETALISNAVTVYPVDFQLSTMKYVLRSPLFLSSFKNSIIVTAAGTLLSVFVTAMAAYPLSKQELPQRKLLTILFVFTMWFSGGMVPTYLVMKQLSLVNTLSALILPGAINVYNLVIVKSYYENLPSSLEESARVDGANGFTVLFRIVIPLSKPVLATITLFAAVGLWNDYFSAMLYITKTSLRTLPLYMRDIIAENQTDSSMVSIDDMHVIPEGIKAATIVASTIPILAVYPFLQKHFIKGIMIGAVKG